MTETKYYIDEQGTYLGGWNANPPANAIEVPFAPDDARQVWQFPGWSPIPSPESPEPTTAQLRSALCGIGLSAEQIEGLFAVAAGLPR